MHEFNNKKTIRQIHMWAFYRTAGLDSLKMSVLLELRCQELWIEGYQKGKTPKFYV